MKLPLRQLLVISIGLLGFNSLHAQSSPSVTDPIIQSSPVVDQRMRHLRRGVNLSHWFSQVYENKAGYTKAHFESHTTSGDFKLIRSLGFDHVRMPVAPEPMFNRDHPETISEEYLKLLDQGIEMILAQGLSVMLDMHPEPPFKATLASQPAQVDAFAIFWKTLARHLSKYDPERLFLEILNEPEVYNAKHWMAMQKQLAEAIRHGAPKHTIIVGGDLWSGIDELLKLEPLPDSNVIYNFHMYDPGLFTHQGATWGWKTWKNVAHIPYPSDPDSIAGPLSTVQDELTRAELANYGKTRWNATIIERKIKRAADWAAKHNVRLLCNEFGVYTRYAAAKDRSLWIKDVRSACERHQIGWTMWDYAGVFALVNKKNGIATPDPQVVNALGLTMPPQSNP